MVESFIAQPLEVPLAIILSDFSTSSTSAMTK
jgi:hypothetical protein